MVGRRPVHDEANPLSAALAMGGYAVGTRAPGPQDSWGYTPESMELMRELRRRWGAGGLLSPGAFVV